jgi:hypothetical protein
MRGGVEYHYATLPKPISRCTTLSNCLALTGQSHLSFTLLHQVPVTRQV